MNVTEMTDEELATVDASMMADVPATGPRSLTPEHRAVKAELGRRAAVRRAKAVRSAAGKKAATSRARRVTAGLPPKQRGFSFDNAPAGGWTEADRVN